MTLRIAHFSDLHVFDISGLKWWEYLFPFKRMTGLANMKLKRGPDVYSKKLLCASLEDALSQKMDHLIVTGDLTNLSLESEFRACRQLMDPYLLRLQEQSKCRQIAQVENDPASQWNSSNEPPFIADPTIGDVFTVCPGNHDVYVNSAVSNQTMMKYFGDAMSDSGTTNSPRIGEWFTRFPFQKNLTLHEQYDTKVRLFGLCSATPTLPFIARGSFASNSQLESLSSSLGNQPRDSVYTIIAMHHPPVKRHHKKLSDFAHGLRPSDRVKMAQICAANSVNMVLNGHTHRPHWKLMDEEGSPATISAEAGSTTHSTHGRYHLYDIGPDGQLVGAFTRVWDAKTQSFSTVERPILQPKSTST